MAKRRAVGKGKATTKQRPARRGAPLAALPADGPVFGPPFFQAVLPGMVKACPCGEKQEPACVLHLADGTSLDVLEVVAIAERFIVLAVFEGAGDDGLERTPDDVGIEAIPFELILRVTVKRAPARSRLGFHLGREELVAVTDAVAATNGAKG